MNFLQEALGEKPIVFFPDSAVIRKAERSGRPLTLLSEEITDAPEKLVAFLQGEKQETP